jgi:hypothetical protein
MDHAPGDLKSGPRRPRDLAVLLLAASHEPPRARARDQQPDIAGGALRRRVLDRLAALDPEPEALEEALAAIVAELGEPTGPTRGVCSLILQEWAESRLGPGYWDWLVSEAIRQGDRDLGPGRGSDRAPR